MHFCLHQVPPLSPMTAWNSDVRGLYPSEMTGDAYSEHLVDMASSLKLDQSGQVFTKSSPTGQMWAAVQQDKQSPCQESVCLSSTLSSTGAQVMLAGHLLSLNGHNNLPNDLDFASLEPGLECDVDQVIRHELSVDGQLDFNFAESTNGMHQMSAAQSVGVSTSMSSSHSWVH